MEAGTHHASGWLTSGLLAGVVSADDMNFFKKALSVFFLAIVAEFGRRLVARLWREKK